MRRFGGDPSIVGRQIHLDGKPYTVVGVLPKWFTYPDEGGGLGSVRVGAATSGPRAP